MHTYTLWPSAAVNNTNQVREQQTGNTVLGSFTTACQREIIYNYHRYHPAELSLITTTKAELASLPTKQRCHHYHQRRVSITTTKEELASLPPKKS